MVGQNGQNGQTDAQESTGAMELQKRVPYWGFKAQTFTKVVPSSTFLLQANACNLRDIIKAYHRTVKTTVVSLTIVTKKPILRICVVFLHW